jgi:hypothetical protein
MEIAMFWPIAAGQFYILSYWLTADIWAFPRGFSIPFKNCPEAFQQPLDISQQLLYTLLAILSGCPAAFKSIPSSYRLKRGHFYPLSLKGHISVNVY